MRFPPCLLLVYSNPITADIAQKIYESPELYLLFFDAQDAKPEDLRTAHQMLMALKRKEIPD